MYKLPVEPYYVNAAKWWLENKNNNNDEFRLWLEDQGVTIKNRDSYYPWLDFEDSFLMTLFRIRWADSVVSTQHSGNNA
jgi:hypothetical protein